MPIPHASFPFDEGSWIPHFHDADDANQKALIAQAGHADAAGHDALARHLMQANPGDDPLGSYHGPFGEGLKGQQFTPDMPSSLYSEYFGDYRPAGGDQSAPGPFSDPRKTTIPGSAGPAVTGTDYLQRALQAGGSGQTSPYGSQ